MLSSTFYGYLTCWQFNKLQNNDGFNIINFLFNWVVVLDFRFNLEQGWIAVHEFLWKVKIEDVTIIVKTDFLSKIQNKNMFAGIKPWLWGSCPHSRSLWKDWTAREHQSYVLSENWLLISEWPQLFWFPCVQQLCDENSLFLPLWETQTGKHTKITRNCSWQRSHIKLRIVFSRVVHNFGWYLLCQKTEFYYTLDCQIK